MTDKMSFGGGAPAADGSQPSADPASALGSTLGAAGAGQDSALMADLIGQIRAASGPLLEFFRLDPMLAPELAQIQQAIQQAIMKKSNAASVQTASSLAVPMGGM